MHFNKTPIKEGNMSLNNRKVKHQKMEASTYNLSQHTRNVHGICKDYK